MVRKIKRVELVCSMKLRKSTMTIALHLHYNCHSKFVAGYLAAINFLQILVYHQLAQKKTCSNRYLIFFAVKYKISVINNLLNKKLIIIRRNISYKSNFDLIRITLFNNNYFISFINKHIKKRLNLNNKIILVPHKAVMVHFKILTLHMNFRKGKTIFIQHFATMP